MIDATILLVQGDPTDEQQICDVLSRSGLPNRVTVARDGTEALDYLFGRGTYADRDVNDLPSLVLLDLALPRLSGIDVLRAIRANPRTRLLRVVVLTASARDEDILDSYAHGATSYVVKPWKPDEFTETITLLLRYWALANQTPRTWHHR